MDETRTFRSTSDNSFLESLNGLRLELSGPKTHPMRVVLWKDEDGEWRITLDEMLAPLVFMHRSRLQGCVFDDDHPDGEMMEQWTEWQKEENEKLNGMLLNFMQTEEGFRFLLAMEE